MNKILIDWSVVEQALEALEKTHTQPGCEQWQAERKASVALRAAPEQEPVAWRHWLHLDGERFSQLTLVPRTDADEPLYTHPPRREWVGLTDEEMVDLQDRCGVTILREDFAAIEAALKGKNT